MKRKARFHLFAESGFFVPSQNSLDPNPLKITTLNPYPRLTETGKTVLYLCSIKNFEKKTVCKGTFMKKLFLFALSLGLFFAITGCSSPSGGSPDEKPSYTITFNANGGSGTMTAQSIASGASAALSANTFTKTGESFAGWATTATGSVSYPDRASYTMGSSSVTLYAIWTTAPSYTVTFDANGGSGTMTSQSIVSLTSAALSENTFSKTGSYFAGWATTTTGLVVYTDRASYTMGSADVTLYAIWTTTPSYKITFNSNGGSGSMDPQSIVSGTSAALTINSFSKTDSAFSGWATTSTGPVEYANGANYVMGSANATLYAIWTALPKYKVTFDANGGSGTMTDQLITSDTSAELTANSFSITGCSFIGWATTLGGSVSYADRASYTMGSADVTLYAVWEADNGLVYRLINNGTEYEVSCGTYAGTTLTIPEYYGGKKVTRIAKNGFTGKTQLTSISLPSSIKSIGDFAFQSCTGLTGSLTIPSGVKSIGGWAFNYCTGLNGSLTIPSSVTSIGYRAFDGCSGLTGSLTIPSGLTSIEASTFFNCKGLTGALTIPSGVTSIGESAFYGCKGLNGPLTIPSGITSIGAHAFSGCKGLTGSLTIPSNLTSIEEYTFGGCKGLTGALTIPSNVKSIGRGAFVSCSGLTGSLTIPSSVTSIESGAFQYCSGLTGDLTIPSSIKFIGASAFANCTGMTGTLTINEGVTSIGISAFSGCSGLTGSLTIPSTVTSISNQTFEGCSGLTGSLIIPSNVKSIGTYAFIGCEGLTGTLTIQSGVQTIGIGAFNKCKGLTGSLTIPSSVTSIENYAFYGCEGLTGTLTIQSGVQSIGVNAFNGCKGLTGSLTIPSSVTSIGENAFSGCKGLTGSLTISDKVTSIGDFAFADCSGLTGSLIIPSGVTSIGEWAFYECEGLTGSLTIPEGVTSIGREAFSGCSGLTGSLLIPSNVKTIGEKAFYDCTGLKDSLLIPSSVILIDDQAFSSFSGTVTINATIPPSLESFVFDYNKLTAIVVPAESVTDYKNANEWIEYKSLITDKYPK
jgi:hypothetical protein